MFYQSQKKFASRLRKASFEETIKLNLTENGSKLIFMANAFWTCINHISPATLVFLISFAKEIFLKIFSKNTFND